MFTHNHSRRVVLRGFLVSGCALSLPRLGRAQDIKLSKIQAQYNIQIKSQRQSDVQQLCKLYRARFLRRL